MKAAVREIRTNGIAVGKGRMVVAKDVVTALEREVARAEELFATARADVARKILGNYVGTAPSGPSGPATSPSGSTTAGRSASAAPSP